MRTLEIKNKLDVLLTFQNCNVVKNAILQINIHRRVCTCGEREREREREEKLASGECFKQVRERIRKKEKKEKDGGKDVEGRQRDTERLKGETQEGK